MQRSKNKLRVVELVATSSGRRIIDALHGSGDPSPDHIPSFNASGTPKPVDENLRIHEEALEMQFVCMREVKLVR